MRKAPAIAAMILLLATGAAARTPPGSLIDGIVPGPDGKIDVVTIFPHQDDETIYVGGSLLRLRDDPRVRVHLVCLTLGDLAGAKDYLHIGGDQLGIIRVSELETAAAVIGAETIQLRYHDQGLSALEPAALAAEMQDLIARTGAEVVVTYGPDGLTGHPDHVAASRAVAAAFKKSAAQRLYFATMPRWTTGIYRLSGRNINLIKPTLAVDIRPVKRLKAVALGAHGTQQHFNGPFPNLEMKNLFNHEWFYLAASNPPPRRQLTR